MVIAMLDQDTVTLSLIHSRTLHSLEAYAARVAENKDVTAAVDFARYILNSGIPKLLEAHPRTEYPPIDGALLRWKAEELERACTERFRSRDSKPHFELCQLQAINDKLNLIAGYVSRLPVAAPVERVPDLKIISGGVGTSPAG